MRIVFFLIIFFCSFLSEAQIDKAFFRLLNDKSFFQIDSSIMFISDTNQRNRSLQPHGVWKTRNNLTKSLLSLTSYYNGKMHGQTIGFYPSGKIANSTYYYLDTSYGPSISFWQNGNLQSVVFYRNGILDGIVRRFDTLGNLQIAYEVKNGIKEGFQIEFYPSGNLKITTNYQFGKEHGQRREYLDNDKFQLMYEKTIKDGG